MFSWKEWLLAEVVGWWCNERVTVCLSDTQLSPTWKRADLFECEISVWILFVIRLRRRESWSVGGYLQEICGLIPLGSSDTFGRDPTLEFCKECSQTSLLLEKNKQKQKQKHLKCLRFSFQELFRGQNIKQFASRRTSDRFGQIFPEEIFTGY